MGGEPIVSAGERRNGLKSWEPGWSEHEGAQMGWNSLLTALVHSQLLFLPLIFCVCQFDHITSHICSVDVWEGFLSQGHMATPPVQAKIGAFVERKSTSTESSTWTRLGNKKQTEPQRLVISGSRLCWLLTLKRHNAQHFHSFPCDHYGLDTGLNLYI